MKRPWFVNVLVVFFVVLGAFLLGEYLQKQEAVHSKEAEEEARYAPMVSADNPLLLAFKGQYEAYEIILACEGDITQDGQPDLVVIYNDPAEPGVTYMRSLLGGGEGEISPPTRAPVENQRIRFFDMDKEAPLEFLVTGEKNGEVGYAIYRMIDGVPTDLFGEGMEACC